MNVTESGNTTFHDTEREKSLCRRSIPVGRRRYWQTNKKKKKTICTFQDYLTVRVMCILVDTQQ